MSKRPFGQFGASMMEIMIALVVAAAVSAVAVPNWQNAVAKKKADRALAALMTISECIKQYKTEYNLSDSGTTPMALATLETYGCINASDIPSNYSFPAAYPMNGGAVPVNSTDGTRAVYVTNIGNLSADPSQVFFFDGPQNLTLNGAQTAGYYRKVIEKNVGTVTTAASQ